MIDLWGKIKSAKYVLLVYSPAKWMGGSMKNIYV